MTRVIKSILGAGLVVAGVLVVGVSSAMAASSSQNTTLSLTVPTSISLTGLAATYSATAPSGVTTNIDTGPITVVTNDTIGYKLVLTAATANFTGSGTNVIPIANDLVQTCTGGICSSGPPALTTTGTTIKTTTGPTSGDTFTVRHGISVPGSQPADTYTLAVTYTATGN